jgi:uncharacterized RDD family membrane protein YckC
LTPAPVGRRVVAWLIDIVIVAALVGVVYLVGLIRINGCDTWDAATQQFGGSCPFESTKEVARADGSIDIVYVLDSGRELPADHPTVKTVLLGTRIVDPPSDTAYLVGLGYVLVVFVLLQGATGRTPGKLLTGVRLVRRDGRSAGVGPALTRWLVVDGLVGLVGVVAGLLDGPPFLRLLAVDGALGLLGGVVALVGGGRGLGDRVAGTVVAGEQEPAYRHGDAEAVEEREPATEPPGSPAVPSAPGQVPSAAPAAEGATFVAGRSGPAEPVPAGAPWPTPTWAERSPESTTIAPPPQWPGPASPSTSPPGTSPPAESGAGSTTPPGTTPTGPTVGREWAGFPAPSADAGPSAPADRRLPGEPVDSRVARPGERVVTAPGDTAEAPTEAPEALTTPAAGAAPALTDEGRAEGAEEPAVATPLGASVGAAPTVGARASAPAATPGTEPFSETSAGSLEAALPPESPTATPSGRVEDGRVEEGRVEEGRVEDEATAGDAAAEAPIADDAGRETVEPVWAEDAEAGTEAAPAEALVDRSGTAAEPSGLAVDGPPGDETVERTTVSPPTREPQWDEARRAYIFWDDSRQEWLQYFDETQSWGPITRA